MAEWERGVVGGTQNRREEDPHQGWRLRQGQRDPGQERPLVQTMGVEWVGTKDATIATSCP